MRFHCGIPEAVPVKKEGMRLAEDAYAILGVGREEGKVAVVRPDGYVGVVGGLAEVEEVVGGYLDGLLRRV